MARNLYGYKSGETALHTAIYYHSHEIFSLFLERPGVDVNATTWHFSDFLSKDSVLHTAIRYDNMPAVQKLLARTDIDLSRQNKVQQTALDLVRKLERHDLVGLLSKRMEAQISSQEDVTVATESGAAFSQRIVPDGDLPPHLKYPMDVRESEDWEVMFDEEVGDDDSESEDC